MELFKINGQLKPRKALVAHHREYVNGLAKQAWADSDNEGEFMEPPYDESELDAYLESRYKEIRRTEYPPIEDFMDAYVKDDTVAIQAYKDKCLAVKAKHKKPVKAV